MKTYTIQRHIHRFLCHTKTCIWHVFMLTSFVMSLKKSLWQVSIAVKHVNLKLNDLSSKHLLSHKSVDQIFVGSLSWWFWFQVSHKAAIKPSRDCGHGRARRKLRVCFQYGWLSDRHGPVSYYAAVWECSWGDVNKGSVLSDRQPSTWQSNSSVEAHLGKRVSGLSIGAMRSYLQPPVPAAWVMTWTLELSAQLAGSHSIAQSLIQVSELGGQALQLAWVSSLGSCWALLQPWRGALWTL